MSKNPFINAFAATAYITIISLVMNFGSKHAPKVDSILAPIAMLSLFTLSAAVMSYLFCYQPLVLYLDNKKKSAVKLFLQTVATFGALTVTALFLLFSGLIK